MKRRRKTATDGIHPVDKHVGARVRMARLTRGMSQTALADATGITFQQVQKYESGKNRVSASRLFEFAGILAVEISYFFDGAQLDEAPAVGEVTTGDTAFTPADIKIMHELRAIKDASLKRVFVDLIGHFSGR